MEVVNKFSDKLICKISKTEHMKHYDYKKNVTLIS